MGKANTARLSFVLFFLSGAFALIYEVCWVRAITLEFGSTTLAISTVLAVFMSGLALGAWLIRSRVDRISAPLTKYGFIEIAIALYALFTPVLFKIVLPQFASLGIVVSDSAWFIAALRIVATALLLLPPTLLMGTTLPLLTRFYADVKHEGKRGGGLLYGINTVGAFVGTLTAGFYLLPEFGNLKTTLFIAIGNLLLGLVAVLYGKKVERAETSVQADAADGTVSDSGHESSDYSIHAAVALTGFAAMAGEVLWTRVLILVLGASVYAFSIVLGTFLAGLGIGAAMTAGFLRIKILQARQLFYCLSVAAGAFVFLSSISFKYLPSLFLNLFWSMEMLKQPDHAFYLQIVIAMLVILIPSLLMGALFPVALHVVALELHVIGRQIASLYTWNTIGAILGSLSAGFLLIPVLGIRLGILTIIAVYFVAAMVSVADKKMKYRYHFMSYAIVALVLLCVLTPSWDRHLMTSAMYNYAYHLKSMDTGQLASTLKQRNELLFYRDGMSATITVTRGVKNGNLGIATNGKYDGSTSRDMANQRLLAHMPLLIHPDPQRVTVIGMGTGCTAGSAALYPVQQVDLVEIEPAMIEGAKFFREDNHFVHDNPKVKIRVTDGRLFLRMHRADFDVIISEPSNPWLAGSSDLFTADFFENAALSLKDGGLFCQWVQIYALSPENFTTLIRTFVNVFPHTYLISSRQTIDVLLLGSKSPFVPDLQRIAQGMHDPAIKNDLADRRVGVNSVHDLLARIRMGPAEVRAMAGPGVLHTDDHPVIAYRAPRDLYVRTEEQNINLLAKLATGIAPYLELHELSKAERIDFLRRLAVAYERFLPGGREAAACQQLIERSK